jgi:hypothetical protein
MEIVFCNIDHTDKCFKFKLSASMKLCFILGTFTSIFVCSGSVLLEDSFVRDSCKPVLLVLNGRDVRLSSHTVKTVLFVVIPNPTKLVLRMLFNVGISNFNLIEGSCLSSKLASPFLYIIS